MLSFLNRYSENIAGWISLFGSSILIIIGDVNSIMAAVFFTIAELMLARYGHIAKGFSIAAAFFIIGNIVLLFSVHLEEDTFVKLSLCGMSIAWLVSVFRYPTEEWAKYKKSEEWDRISKLLPAITGTANVFFKTPGAVFAFLSGNFVLGVAITAWVLSDIFAGRLQERLYVLYLRLKTMGK